MVQELEDQRRRSAVKRKRYEAPWLLERKELSDEKRTQD